ncbi:IbpA Molecular chaperone (small heat shock protein) [uncultured Caudovirales phage]|uniref:IbpA Molecular chaperone (Small heat shock protein) n=1 Tax=uncultured Caudovirales phage TaxID=2100421 RepID=A0A6J5NSZ5_9CAUD|nr:IbpA Molecular chaperone (small heat shock protein) [uncultured Caudovirales phage]
MSNPWTNYKFDHTFSDLAKFDKYFIGAEKFLARVQETADLLANSATNSTYPPFNLKKTEENKYVIEMAVAGFGKQDIELTLDGNKLNINGHTTIDTLTADGVDQTFIHKGISDRPFARTFTLADNVVVDNAQYINGILKIWLNHMVPESQKPKKIKID